MKVRTFPVVVALALGLTLGSFGSAFAAEMFEGLPVVKVLLNGAPLKADVPPVVLAGRTLLPVRAIAEAAGIDVKWDAATSTVVLTTKPVVYADPYIKATNAVVQKDSHGMTELMVDITNVYNQPVSGPISVTFYDHNGRAMGSAKATVGALAPGATRAVSLMADKYLGDYGHYKVNSDIMGGH